MIHEQTPQVTVVVPTYNRCELLRRLLDSLRECWAQASVFEVVVVVDGSIDGTREMLESLLVPFPLRVYHQQNAGPAAARNLAAREARGWLVQFLDDDVVASPDLIREHLGMHAEHEHAAVVGPMLPPPGAKLPPWLEWEAANIDKQYRAMQAGWYRATARQFYTGNASVRKVDLLAAGLFEVSLRRAEDVELAYRMARGGVEFVFAPDAEVHHEPDRSFVAWRRLAYDYGQADVLMARDLGHPYVLHWAYKDWPRRHWLNRMLPTLCVGRPRLQAVVLAALKPIATGKLPAVPRLVRRIALSAIYNVRYWQGVADASGFGRGVWNDGPRWDSELTALSSSRLGAPPA